MQPHYESLHASMEALGALCALVMGLVLWQRARRDSGAQPLALAAGFLGMGVLEMFHAVSPPGNAFILLRHLASLVGGIGFACVWLPGRRDRPIHHAVPWLVAAGALVCGVAVMLARDTLPDMMRNGELAPTAVGPIALASMLFFAGASRFLLDYRRDSRAESLLFGCLALLFAVAELIVTYSVPWDARWWMWHALRLLAYMLVLGYMVRGYQSMVFDLRVSLAHTRDAEEAARGSERQLRRVMEQRERMAQDLHDGIIQTLFALSLSLERCQRLVTTDVEEVGRQLGVGVQGLKAAIRDLRVFIGGLEPPLSDVRELEAALALQVRLLNASSDLQIDVRVDRSVADFVTPEQASHILYVAREALSNALRHARATRGTIALEPRNGHVRLTVEDDGVGFAVAAAASGEGLKNMAARAAKINGTLTVTSQPGRTCVIFELPKERVYA